MLARINGSRLCPAPSPPETTYTASQEQSGAGSCCDYAGSGLTYRRGIGELMEQAFNYHMLAGAGADLGLIDAHSGDIVTEYLTYLALVSFAAAVVIVSLGFSANVAVGFLDRIVKPTFVAHEATVVPTPSNISAGAWHTSTYVAR